MKKRKGLAAMSSAKRKAIAAAGGKAKAAKQATPQSEAKEENGTN